MSDTRGKVYLVGAGPGDPELLTLKALRLLRAADVVLYDRLVGPEILALANPAAKMVYAGKHEGEQEAIQNWICEQILAEAAQGRTVLRLKGGDPCVFGRGAEEWLLLRQHDIDVEIVPGVSSAVAVPATAGIPVTFRGLSRSFAVVTGHCCKVDEMDWSRVAGIDTLVILMGVKEREAIARALIAAGRPPREPAAFIERGTTPEERVVESTLADIARGTVEVNPPAVLVVGAVVALRRELTDASVERLLAAEAE